MITRKLYVNDDLVHVSYGPSRLDLRALRRAMIGHPQTVLDVGNFLMWTDDEEDTCTLIERRYSLAPNP